MSGFPWPAPADLLRPREPFLLPIVLLLATRLPLWWLIPTASEDAYITFRFARNWAEGNGLTYNPGDPVFGFSSPLWTLWMGIGDKLTRHPELWSRVWSLAADAVTLILATSALRAVFSRPAAWCFAIFFSGWPYFAAVSTSGMENSAMLALMVLGAAAVRDRSWWSGPALAAVALMRPEGPAAALVLALDARWRDRGVAAAAFAGACVWLWATFGTFIPQSVTAKSAIYGTPGPWAGRAWWDWLSPFIFGRVPDPTDTVHLFLLSVVLGPSVVLGARALWPHRGSAPGLLVGACLVVWLGYVTLGVAYFWWYLLIPLAGFAVLGSIGFPQIVRGRALPISCALMVAGMWTITPHLYVGRAQTEYLSFGRAASFLRANARAGQSVLLEPIGIVGFRAPVVVIDEIGLVSPWVAKRRTQGPGWYADVVAKARPDWLVVRNGMLQTGSAFAGIGAPFRNLSERDAMLASYQVVTAVDSTAGPQALLILARRP